MKRIRLTFLLMGLSNLLLAQQIVGYEYWFDANLYAKTSVSVAATDVLNLQTSIQVPGLSLGFHSIHVRVFDDSSHFSAPINALFYTKTLGNVFTAYRYWFDQDMSGNIEVSISSANTTNLLLTLDAEALTDGTHLIHIQFKDFSGRWSATKSAYFFKRGNLANLANVDVTAYRFWFDQPSTLPAEIALSNPDTTVVLANAAACGNVTKGWHNISYQLKDRSGIWSSAITDSFYRNAIPIADFAMSDSLICISADSVAFLNFAVDADSVHWNFGDGTTSNVWNPKHLYQQTGIFTVSQTAVDKTTGFSDQKALQNAVSVEGLPTANYTYLINNLTVQFNNNSAWASSYLWLFGDGDSSYLQHPTHTFLNAGTYAVELVSTGLCGKSSNSQSVLLSFGEEENGLYKFLALYPNPAIDYVTLNFQFQKNAALKLAVYDVTGKAVFYKNMNCGTELISESISITNWPRGLYVIKLETFEGTRVLKLVAK